MCDDSTCEDGSVQWHVGCDAHNILSVHINFEENGKKAKLFLYTLIIF